jgi:hypothetical protein
MPKTASLVVALSVKDTISLSFLYKNFCLEINLVILKETKKKKEEETDEITKLQAGSNL